MGFPEKSLAYGRKKSCIRELAAYATKRKQEIGDDKVFDFSLGNPSITPPAIVDETIIDIVSNRKEKIHAYTPAIGTPKLRSVVAEDLNKMYGTNIDSEHVYISTGAAGALMVSFRALANHGDEIIAVAPYYTDYKTYIEGSGATIRVVESKPDFNLDIEKIKEAVNEKTAAIIINSPSNPSGIVYSKEDLMALATVLKEKEEELNRKIFILSDEPYRELLYVDDYHSPIEYYDDTLICYSWSKSLSLPGERIGYIAINDKCDVKDEVYTAIKGAARLSAFVNPPSLLQYVMEVCHDKVVDTSEYKQNRELLVNELGKMGYEFASPDGAFYLFIKALEEDAQKFSDKAKEFELLLVPSDGFGVKGYVRLAYCVKTDMIKASLPKFKELMDYYKNNCK